MLADIVFVGNLNQTPLRKLYKNSVRFVMDDRGLANTIRRSRHGWFIRSKIYLAIDSFDYPLDKRVVEVEWNMMEDEMKVDDMNDAHIVIVYPKYYWRYQDVLRAALPLCVSIVHSVGSAFELVGKYSFTDPKREPAYTQKTDKDFWDVPPGDHRSISFDCKKLIRTDPLKVFFL
jgi:hypothetical protein